MKKSILPIILLCSINITHATNNEERINRKINEINRIVQLTNEQDSIIRNAYSEYIITTDSALYFVKDIRESLKIKYLANKKFSEIFMSALSEKQMNDYITLNYTQEINDKTEYRISLLKEHKDYTEEELNKLRKEIFSYLMCEKIVYIKNKFNIFKQKRSIRKLKEIQPNSVKASTILEKIKLQGNIKNGTINFETK